MCFNTIQFVFFGTGICSLLASGCVTHFYSISLWGFLLLLLLKEKSFYDKFLIKPDEFITDPGRASPTLPGQPETYGNIN